MVNAIYVQYLVIQDKLELFQKGLSMCYMAKNVLNAMKIVEDVICQGNYVLIATMQLKECKVGIVVVYSRFVINIRL
jgi:hypothetical protein